METLVKRNTNKNEVQIILQLHCAWDIVADYERTRLSYN